MSSRSVKIVDGGKLVIPAAFRRELGIDTGDTVVVEPAGDGLRVRGFSPGAGGLADQLIAERRAEAEPATGLR